MPTRRQKRERAVVRPFFHAATPGWCMATGQCEVWRGQGRAGRGLPAGDEDLGVERGEFGREVVGGEAGRVDEFELGREGAHLGEQRLGQEFTGFCRRENGEQGGGTWHGGRLEKEDGGRA